MTLCHYAQPIEWLRYAAYPAKQVALGYEEADWFGWLLRHLVSPFANALSLVGDLLACTAHLVNAVACKIWSAQDIDHSDEWCEQALWHWRCASLIVPLTLVHAASAIYPPCFSHFSHWDGVNEYLYPRDSYLIQP